MRAGGGESREGMGEAYGLLRGGLRMLLMGWPLRGSLAAAPSLVELVG